MPKQPSKPAKKKAAPKIKWECLVCHTLNDRGNVCSHCGTPRPK